MLLINSIDNIEEVQHFLILFIWVGHGICHNRRESIQIGRCTVELEVRNPVIKDKSIQQVTNKSILFHCIYIRRAYQKKAKARK
jgi:hypothetical protein